MSNILALGQTGDLGSWSNSGGQEEVAGGGVGEVLHPVLKREDRLRKHPFAGFGTVMEDIRRTSHTKNQPILLGAF